MLRRGLSIFTGLLLSYASTYGQEDLRAVIKKVQPSIVSILVLNPEGQVSGQGSGFFITRDGDVVTSRHVLEGAIRAGIITSEGKGYPVREVVAEDEEGDLIRLSVNLGGLTVPSLDLSPNEPEIGEHIFVIGTPLGLEKTVTDGIVSAVREVPSFGKVIQVTAPISPGSSGSPVVNMQGEAVGVATFFVVSGQNLNFAIPVERVRRLNMGNRQTLAEREEKRGEKIRTTEHYQYAMGLGFLLAEEYEKALFHFLEAVKQNPNRGETFFQIGYCLARLGKYTQAVEFYRKALQIKPDDGDTHNNLCVALGMTGNYAEALTACDDAIRFKPDFAEPYNNRGWNLHQLGRYPEAVASCKQAIRLQPDFPLAHYNLGNSHSSLKQYPEAVESYKQGIRLRFDHAEGHLNLGAVYFQTGRYEEAIASYRQALQLKPDLAEAHLNLGMSYLKAGDRGSALGEYKILRALDKPMADRLFNLIYE